MSSSKEGCGEVHSFGVTCMLIYLYIYLVRYFPKRNRHASGLGYLWF